MGLIGGILFRQIFGRHPFKEEETVSKSTESFMGPNFSILKAYTMKGIEMLGRVDHETLSITAGDGPLLIGYLYKNSIPTDNTVVCVHGYNSDGISDFANIALEYLKRGFNVLLVNNRACGPSEGEFASFGVMESGDTLLWLNKIAGMFPDGNIILQGCSMGAATVCMLAGRELPENVRVLVSDCAFALISGQFRYTLKHFMHLPPWPAMNMLEKEFERHYGCGFDTYSPLKSVSNSRLPMFFAHGREDRYVPASNAQRLYDACPTDRELMLVDKAGHAAAHMYGGDGYYSAILSFAAKYMR